MDETECEHACSGVKLSLKVNSCHFQKNERIDLMVHCEIVPQSIKMTVVKRNT